VRRARPEHGERAHVPAAHLEALGEPPAARTLLPAVLILAQRLQPQLRLRTTAQVQVGDVAAARRTRPGDFHGQVAEQVLRRPALIEKRAYQRDDRRTPDDASGAEVGTRIGREYAI